MNNAKNNCYGFVYAGIHNIDEDIFCDRDDLHLACLTRKKAEIAENTAETAQEILDILQEKTDKTEWKVLELFDNEKRSQHVAFLDAEWNFYDQNGPDGEIRLNQNLEDLLDEYKKLFGDAYYQVYQTNIEQAKNIENFINTYQE